MGRAARNNPVAVAAKKGEIPPKEKPISKREMDRRMHRFVRALLMREMIRPGSLKKELIKERESGESGKESSDAE